MLMIFVNGMSLGSLLQYLQTFATLFLGWEVKMAALLNFALGISIVAGRFVASFVSEFLESQFLVVYCLTSSIIGMNVTLAVSLGYLSTLTMWVGSFILGFGLGPIVAGIFVWTNQVTGLSAVQAATLAVGIFAGVGLGPMLTSLLLASFGYMAIMYVLYFCCSFQVLIYLALHFISKQMTKQRKKLWNP